VEARQIDMEMKNILLIICLFVSFNAYSQSDKIVYILSDSVEVSIKNRITIIRKKHTKVFFSCMLFNDKDDTHGISLFVNDGKSSDDFINILLKKTNRVLLVDKEELPLITDYDVKYSSPNLKRIGEFGKREGNISRSKLLFHGYTVFFNSRGEIIRVSDY
jgi:hypothetical protein